MYEQEIPSTSMQENKIIDKMVFHCKQIRFHVSQAAMNPPILAFPRYRNAVASWQYSHVT